MIPADKLVVVTGDPRSGTSLMMQTLNLLGVPIAGEDFPAWQKQQQRAEEEAHMLQRQLHHNQIDQEAYDLRFGRIQEQVDERETKMRSMNPGGFYEVPMVVMRGLQEVGEHGGKAIKIVSPGAYPQGERGTPAEIVHKYILCLRDPKSVAQSQTRLTHPITGILGIDDMDWALNPSRYVYENGGLASYVAKLADRSAWLTVDFDSFVAAPAATITAICNHLGMNPGRTTRDAAAANVQPSLNRSKDNFTAWPQTQAIKGQIAENLYAAIKADDYNAVQAVEPSIATEREKDGRERAQWYDPSVGMVTTAFWHRDAASRPEIMTARLTMFRNELRRGMHPMSSPEFSEPANAKDYTIKRPADFGDLTRKHVLYQGESMTWEDCFRKHQTLWANGQCQRDRAVAETLAGAV